MVRTPVAKGTRAGNGDGRVWGDTSGDAIGVQITAIGDTQQTGFRRAPPPPECEIRANQPGLKRMGFPLLPDILAFQVVLAQWTAVAQGMGVTMVRLPWPLTVAGIDATLVALRERVQAIEFGLNSALRGAGWQQITAWGISNQVLTCGAELARGQEAFAFGANGPSFANQLFDQIDRVLRGANPAQMPIQRPTVFDVVINRKIIQEMGLTVPRSVLLQVTEVID